MKAITKRFLAVFLSLFLIIAPTIQQANAASSWSITGAVSAGARAIVSATKSGYKSAVNISPTAVRLGAGLLRIGNTASLIFAATQLANDGFDFVLDPANNQIKYKEKSALTGNFHINYGFIADTPLGSCQLWAASLGGFSTKIVMYDGGRRCTYANGDIGPRVDGRFVEKIEDKTITIPAAAAQVLKNAQAGNAAAQAAVRDVATEMVIGGQFDQDLLAGAVPTNDTKPLVPSVPISGNGNVTHGESWEGGDGMSGATPGQQADAAKDAADAARKAAQAAADAATAAAEDARRAADEAADLVNSGADTDAIDAANDRAKAAEQAAADAKAAADAAIDAAADRAAAAEAAADRAAAAADARAAAAEAAAEAAAQAARDAAEAEKAAAQAAADKAAAEAAKARAEAAAAKEKAKAAEKAAEKAKAEAQKPFELPAFCTWASIVCETAEWLKREPDAPGSSAVEVDNPIQDFDTDKSYVTFTGSCPPKYTASLNVMGATAPFEFDYTPICTVMSALKPFIVGAGYIAAAYIIAGHSRGSKD